MKIYAIAIALLLFSGIITLFNDLNLFNQKMYEPGYNVSQSEANGIYQIDAGNSIESKEGWMDKIGGGIDLGWKIILIVYHTLSLGLNLGGLFEKYVPGSVGQGFGTLITAATYFVYAWGGIQIWRKVSTKGME